MHRQKSDGGSAIRIVARTLLKATAIRKSFGPNEVLRGIDFDVRAGEVHALLGENGAGKSTFLNILSGRLQPSDGSIEIGGQTPPPLTPRSARSLGIEIVPQHVELIEDLSIADNIFLGRWPANGPWIDSSRMFAQSADLLTQVGVELDPRNLVRNLTYVEKQMVEIARINQFNPKVIILDEPTAALSVREIQILFSLVKRLCTTGIGFIFVTHYLTEVAKITDRVTVLRDGKVAATGPTTEFTIRDLIHHMVGDLSDLYGHRNRRPGQVLFALRNARTELIDDISLELHEGEVLGIAAPKGEGISELFRAICRISGRLKDGNVVLNGNRLWVRNSAHAFRMGLGYLSEDRKRWGLIRGRSVRENLTTSTLADYATRIGLLSLWRENAAVRGLVEQFHISTPNVESEINILSGGNQQKALVARLFNAKLPVYLIDNPTFGVDVRSKAQVHRLLCDEVDRGAGILLHSSDLEELIQLSDRVLLFKKGRVEREIGRGEVDVNELERLLEA